MRRYLSLLLFSYFPINCYAATGQNSWEVVLSKISHSLTGPVAYALATIAVFCCGMIIAFTDIQNGGKRFVGAAIGIVIAAFAAGIVTKFFGVSGAIL